MKVCIWPKPSNIITKPTTAAVVSGIIIGKPSSSSPIMINIRMVAISNLPVPYRVTAVSDLGLGISVAIHHAGREVDVLAGEVLDGCQEILDSGNGETDGHPYIDDPDRYAQGRQNAATAIQRFDVAVGVVTQEKHHHRGKQGDEDHQYLSAFGGQGVVYRRHPDVATMAGGVTNTGKGDQNDQDAVDLTREKQAFSEHKTPDHVGAGVDSHEDDAGGEHDGLDLGDPLVDGAQKAW